MPDSAKSLRLSITAAAAGVLVAFAITACTSGPEAKPQVRIPQFSTPAATPTSTVPPTTTDPPTTAETFPDEPTEPTEPTVEPPAPPPATKTATPPKATPPPPPTQTPPIRLLPIPPPPAKPNNHFARQGAFCAPEGATAFTRGGTLLVCSKGPNERLARWRKE